MLKNTLRLIFVAYLLAHFGGCAIIEEILPAKLSASSPVRVDRIDDKKAIIRYEYGPSIHTDSKQLAEKAIQDFCGSENYHIITEGELFNSNKQWTKTLVVECVDRYELHINY